MPEDTGVAPTQKPDEDRLAGEYISREGREGWAWLWPTPSSDADPHRLTLAHAYPTETPFHQEPQNSGRAAKIDVRP